MHEKLGSVLLPMALQDPAGSHLLSAILYASTMHRTSLRIISNQEQVLALKYNSIRLLRQQIDGHDSTLLDVRIATSLVLCLAETIAGSEQTDSWRTHLHGASAMLELSPAGSHQCCQDIMEICTTRTILYRWCQSFELLTLLTGCSSESFKLTESRICCVDRPYISIFDGFSTRLIPVFRDIDRLLKDTRTILTQQATDSGSTMICNTKNGVVQRSIELVNRIDGMSSCPTRRLDPWIEPSQPPNSLLDSYELVNQTYHHAALLQVFQVMGMESTDAQIVSTLDAMIECFEAISLNEGPGPGVTTLYPIFIAGCNSKELVHREFVMNWMSQMTKLFAMSNVECARRFLIDLWDRRDDQRSEDVYLTWDSLYSELPISSPWLED